MYNNNDLNKIIIFTDGSSSVFKKNGIRYGGIGVHFQDNPLNNISVGYEGVDVTNQRMELSACIKGIEKCIEFVDKNTTEIHIYTDSMYVINCITAWASKWEKLGWKREVNGVVKDNLCNLDLIKPLYNYSLECKLKFHHVRSHQKEPPENNKEKWTNWYGNDSADKLANSAMMSLRNLSTIKNNKK